MKGHIMEKKKQKESIFTPLQYMSFKALTKVSKKESMLVSNQQPQVSVCLGACMCINIAEIYLCVTNSRTSSQENHKMKAFHKKIAVPFPLRNEGKKIN
jgi:hypothetical protein